MLSEAAETPEVESQEGAPEASDAEAGAEEEPFDRARAEAKIKKANSEAAGLRARLKELEPLADKAKELEDASKSESEKLTEKHAAAEKRAAEAEDRAVRLEVAMETGLSTAQVKRLVGSTKEELVADAKELMESFQAEPEKTPLPSRPRERMVGGTNPDQAPEPDPDEVVKRVRRGR